MKRPLLIADGDPEVCDMYGQFLTDRGYAVETSSDGLDCLSKLRQRTPSVLILDLGLPWGGGDGVLDWIRDETPKHGIPVILTATVGYPDDFERLMEPPVAEVLQKPFALADLLEAVRCAIAKAQPMQKNTHRVHSELFIG